MEKNINEMLNILRENKLTNIAVGWNSSCEHYTGLRRNTVCIVSTKNEFLNSEYNSLAIIEDGKLLEENIKNAYSLMLMQNMSLPHII